MRRVGTEGERNGSNPLLEKLKITFRSEESLYSFLIDFTSAHKVTKTSDDLILQLKKRIPRLSVIYEFFRQTDE